MVQEVCMFPSHYRIFFSSSPLTASVILPSANISLAWLPYNQSGNQLMLFPWKTLLHDTVVHNWDSIAELTELNVSVETISLSKLHVISQILDKQREVFPAICG